VGITRFGNSNLEDQELHNFNSPCTIIKQLHGAQVFSRGYLFYKTARIVRYQNSDIRACHLYAFWAKVIQSTLSQLFSIMNLIFALSHPCHPSGPPSFRFRHQNSVCILPITRTYLTLSIARRPWWVHSNVLQTAQLMERPTKETPATSSLVGPIFSLATNSLTPSAYVLPLTLLITLCTHTLQQAKLHFCNL
jgi:hypothetical protein